MHPHGLVLGVAGLALSIAAVTSSAQQPSPVFRGRSDLVLLDVMVGDKQGGHVSGLTRDDFDVYVAGRRVEVAVLAENRNERPATPRVSSSARSDVASNETIQRDRIIMLVIDDVHIRRDSTEAARAAASRFVEGIGGRAQVAVLFTSGRPGLEFTTDPQALLAAVQGLTGRENAMVGRGQTMWPGRTANMDPSQGARAAIPQPGSHVQAQAGKDLLDSTMQQSLDKLPKHDGRRKAIVLISEGDITRQVGAAAADPGADYSIAGVPEKGLYTSPTPTGVNRILGDFVEAVRKTGTSVYAIDPRGKATMGQEGYLGADDFLNQDDVARQRQTSLRRYTEETGGFAVVDSDDFVTGVERVVDDLDDYYVLGFPPLSPKDTKMHRVEVRVKRPGLEVRHRLMYQLDNSQPSGLRPKDALAALAASPIPSGELPLRVWATTVAPSSPKAPARLALWLESPTGSIAEYGVYPFSLAAKKEVQPLARTMKGAVPTLVQIECPALPPGTYQLRVAARTASAGGSTYLTVEIPAFAKVQLAISALVIGEGFDSRTDVAPLIFAPTLSREFAGRSTLRVGFDVWQPQAPEQVDTVIAILDAEGREVERIDRSLAVDGTRRVDAALALGRLTPGAYALKVTATSPLTSTASSIAFSIARP